MTTLVMRALEERTFAAARASEGEKPTPGRKQSTREGPLQTRSGPCGSLVDLERSRTYSGIGCAIFFTASSYLNPLKKEFPSS
jgi:hypothetical protein